ncbi:hypothetical protein DYD21_05185 [Rhodohalobacter sp. SW132]|uniref:hypothetical protein n=1 Tax=Rhodohalobacter sp. SW132 TaxID=2293433 RepID=UPI000E27CB4B|nr:hypothetical protein [Rhodohalobacter sp. SW132]REL38013.1 hypothetical protein DYD21_05185 [Rhodohalobacter sp. SW132]
MNSQQKVWYVSGIVVLICLLIAAIIYKFTGHIFLAIIFAPPLVHYFLKKPNGIHNGTELNAYLPFNGRAL